MQVHILMIYISAINSDVSSALILCHSHFLSVIARRVIICVQHRILLEPYIVRAVSVALKELFYVLKEVNILRLNRKFRGVPVVLILFSSPCVRDMRELMVLKDSLMKVYW